MIVISITDFRGNIKSYLSKMKDSFEKLLITNKGENYVLMSEKEYESLMEYNYLMASDNNKNHIETALKEFEQGKYRKASSTKDLFDDLGI
ncbi:MAG: type II toxin-antitoxin system Phd/YefM family antitoxin [Cyclobacteriaceae bacterium]